MKKPVIFLTQASIIAAVYAVLTLILAPISFGVIQLRISEILCVLPFFTAAAVPGLFIGCFLANLISSIGVIDIILGSVATLIAAAATHFMPKYLAPLPPVISNGFIIGAMLHFVENLPFWPTAAAIMLEESIICFGGGIPLMLLLEKYRNKLFL